MVGWIVEPIDISSEDLYYKAASLGVFGILIFFFFFCSLFKDFICACCLLLSVRLCWNEYLGSVKEGKNYGVKWMDGSLDWLA